jgi:hypothetical membrane protein
MTRDIRLLFGPLGAAILLFGIGCLGAMVPGYSQVHQTVSEIGEIGSPTRVSFAIMLFAVAACVLVFAAGVRAASLSARHSTFAAWLVGFMAVPCVGIGIFAFPHPLHNLFGLSELIGYQAPLVFALSWRRDPRAKTLATFSWIMYAAVWIALGLNMIPMFGHSEVWARLHPVYGIIQRLLFATWFGWGAVVGAMLYQSTVTTAPRNS